MRLWTLHPMLLDRIGLVAQWREGLLAQRVLEGRTKGYTNHPQLARFRACPNPLGMIASFLRITHDEAARRGYSFDRAKIINRHTKAQVNVSVGQIEYELHHLRSKVKSRDPGWLHTLKLKSELVQVCDMFQPVPGPIEHWERIRSPNL